MFFCIIFAVLFRKSYNMLASIQKRLNTRSGLDFYLVLLLVGIFIFLRSFDLFVLQSYFSNKNVASSFGHLRLANFTDLSLSAQSFAIPVDQEMETEEKEKDDSSEIYITIFSDNEEPSFYLQAYNRIVENRRQQQVCVVRQQPTVPYFILYHSWKGFLLS